MDRERKERERETHRQAVEDDVFLGGGGGACRQGYCAVIGQAERKALIGRRLEVEGSGGSGWLQLEGLETKQTNNYLI